MLLCPSFWHHALEMATYLLNILPTKVLGFRSPTQVLYQCDPIYSELRVFGCLCFPLFPSTSIHKLQERSTPCVYLGPAPNHRGSKCYDMSCGKLIICRHVKFFETEFPFSKLHPPHTADYNFLDVNPILHHIHTQRTNPQNVAHHIDHASPPSHVGSTNPTSPPHSPLGHRHQAPHLTRYCHIEITRTAAHFTPLYPRVTWASPTTNPSAHPRPTNTLPNINSRTNSPSYDNKSKKWYLQTKFKIFF